MARIVKKILGLRSEVVLFPYISAVNFICDHPDIKAISFVGSDQAVSTVKVDLSRN